MKGLGFGQQHSQGPDVQLKAFIGKGKLTEKWPPNPHCLRQPGPPPESPGKKGTPNWAVGQLRYRGQSQCVWSCRTVHREGPASGNKHRLRSSLRSPRSAGRESRADKGLVWAAVGGGKEEGAYLHLGAGEGSVQLSIPRVLPFVFPHDVHQTISWQLCFYKNRQGHLGLWCPAPCPHHPSSTFQSYLPSG